MLSSVDTIICYLIPIFPTTSLSLLLLIHVEFRMYLITKKIYNITRATVSKSDKYPCVFLLIHSLQQNYLKFKNLWATEIH